MRWGSFAALYLATSPEVSLGEISRHLTPRLLSSLNDFRLSELSVSAEKILDCRDPASVGLSSEHLAHDTDYEASQALGAAAFAEGFEGLSSHRRPGSGTRSSSFRRIWGKGRGSKPSPAGARNSMSNAHKFTDGASS